MVDVAGFEDFLDIRLLDVDRSTILGLGESALSDLQRHADEVEGLAALKDAGLALIVMVPDLFDD